MVTSPVWVQVQTTAKIRSDGHAYVHEIAVSQSRGSPHVGAA